MHGMITGYVPVGVSTAEKLYFKLLDFLHGESSFDRFDMLSALSSVGTMALRDLIDSVGDGEKVCQLFQQPSKQTVLHFAAWIQRALHIVFMLDTIDASTSSMFDLMRARDETGQTFFYNIKTSSDQVISAAKGKLDTQQWAELMCTQDNEGGTWLHTAAGTLQVDTVKLILESLEPESRWFLLNIQDNKGERPLDKLVSEDYTHMVFGNTDQSLVETMIQQVFNTLENESQRLLLGNSMFQRLIMPRYIKLHKHNVQGFFVGNEFLQLMKTILGCLTTEQQLELIGEGEGTELYLQQLSADEQIDLGTEVSFLREQKATLKVNKALSARLNDSERAALIVNIIEHESISVEQILELSPHSSRYLVPFNQSKSKHHGLIFFNTEDRQGAENEASYMKQALQLTGCEIIQQEWSAAHQLGDMIDNALTDILAECSLLVVCIMTHGYRGTLSGGEGTEISVNDVLNQLTTSLPGHLPLILVIQACQGLVTQTVSAASGDAAPTSQASDPHYNKHIVLRRPHTLLLLATVMGGVAYRGLFTGAIADEISRSDGKTDVYTMFTKATEKSRQYQTPEVRSTQQKQLLLPPATRDTALS